MRTVLAYLFGAVSAVAIVPDYRHSCGGLTASGQSCAPDGPWVYRCAEHAHRQALKRFLVGIAAKRPAATLANLTRLNEAGRKPGAKFSEPADDDFDNRAASTTVVVHALPALSDNEPNSVPR